MIEVHCLNNPEHIFYSYSSANRKYCSLKCELEHKKKKHSSIAYIREKFWSKVDVGDDDECWPHKAKKHDKYGYRVTGYARKDGSWKPVLAHRLAYMLTYGKISKDICVLHKCDNPPCCNPNHLFLGTNYDNVMDKVKKKRQQKGENVWSAVLIETDVLVARRLHELGYNNEFICRLLNTSNESIRNAVNGHTWKHI